jgi:hypothetical protein
VVYLVFNHGWGGGRVDLAIEAIQLGQTDAERRSLNDQLTQLSSG